MAAQSNGAFAPVVFSFQSTDIRTFADDHGEPWFCANDVCKVLGYTNSRKAISDHCRDRGVTKRYTPSRSCDQEMTFINEGNLYRLIIKSKKPEAEKFEIKVMEEILPAIRKTGSYVATPHITPEQQGILFNLMANRFPDGRDKPYGWARFNNHYKINSYKNLPFERFADACDYIGKLPTKVTALPAARKYNYPRELLGQPDFTSSEGTVRLDINMLANRKFISPLFGLLNELRTDGHEVTAALTEAEAMRQGIIEADTAFDQIWNIALKTKVRPAKINEKGKQR